MNAIKTGSGKRADCGGFGAARLRLEPNAAGNAVVRDWRHLSVPCVSLLCCAMLAACGGGGGGGGGGPMRFTTSFSQVSSTPNEFSGHIEMAGEATSITVRTLGSSIFVIGDEKSNPATVRIRAENGNVLSFNLRSRESNVNIYAENLAGNDAMEADDGTALYIDPIKRGFEYQTFGIWSKTESGTTASWGAASFGRRTAAANMPSGGAATYEADALGLAVDGSRPYLTTSNIEITTANYADVDITSSNTYRTQITSDGSPQVPERDSSLDFQGTGSVSGSGFSINIQDNGSRRGEAVGSFYGPRAEEVGGTYNIRSGNFSHIGAFGGIRQ